MSEQLQAVDMETPMTSDLNEPDNMQIWNAVSTTDPSATKNYKGAGGFAGTAISSLYPVMIATKVFGPVGLGWGYDIVDESYVQGAPIYTGEGDQIGIEQTHTIRISVWAIIEGQKACAEHFGHTPHIHKNKYGIQTDHEAPKKSLTDAIKKALSMWGFSADVFMGLYDDHEYVEALKEKEAVEKSDDKAATKLKQAQEYNDWKDDNLKLVNSSVSMNELQALFSAAVKKANRNNDEAFIKKLTKAKDKRKGELEEKAA